MYSQQNEVSERKNMSIMEMTRCMLHEKNLSKEFWTEDHTSVFLLDRLWIKAQEKKTP